VASTSYSTYIHGAYVCSAVSGSGRDPFRHVFRIWGANRTGTGRWRVPTTRAVYAGVVHQPHRHTRRESAGCCESTGIAASCDACSRTSASQAPCAVAAPLSGSRAGGGTWNTKTAHTLVGSVPSGAPSGSSSSLVHDSASDTIRVPSAESAPGGVCSSSVGGYVRILACECLFSLSRSLTLSLSRSLALSPYHARTRAHARVQGGPVTMLNLGSHFTTSYTTSPLPISPPPSPLPSPLPGPR